MHKDTHGFSKTRTIIEQPADEEVEESPKPSSVAIVNHTSTNV